MRIYRQAEQFSWRIAAHRTAMPADYLWRGINIHHPGDDYTGDSILDHIRQEGQRRGTGMGRHWTTMPDYADGYAEFGEETDDYDAGGPDRLQVRMKATPPSDGSGVDPDRTGTGEMPGHHYDDDDDDPWTNSEVTMLPSAQMTIHDVQARRPGESQWRSLPFRHAHRTAMPTYYHRSPTHLQEQRPDRAMPHTYFYTADDPHDVDWETRAYGDQVYAADLPAEVMEPDPAPRRAQDSPVRWWRTDPANVGKMTHLYDPTAPFGLPGPGERTADWDESAARQRLQEFLSKMQEQASGLQYVTPQPGKTLAVGPNWSGSVPEGHPSRIPRQAEQDDIHGYLDHDDDGHVNFVYTAPALRGFGIGTKLLDHAGITDTAYASRFTPDGQKFHDALERKRTAQRIAGAENAYDPDVSPGDVKGIYDPPESMDVPWYHTSNEVFKPGDVLTGGHRPNWKGFYDQGHAGRGDWVWLEHRPSRALGWQTLDRSGRNSSRFYEVKPHEGPYPWNGVAGDGWVAPAAKVVREISREEMRQLEATHYTAHHRTAHRTAMPNEDYRGSHRPGGPDHGAPFHDLSQMWGEDIYDHPEWYDSMDYGIKNIQRQLNQARGNPDHPVVIYRALPPGVTDINTGDWVTTSLPYARAHAVQSENPEEDLPIVRSTVPAKHVWTNNDLHEWGYHGPNVRGDACHAHRTAMP